MYSRKPSPDAEIASGSSDSFTQKVESFLAAYGPAAEYRTADAETDWASEPAFNPMLEEAYWRENYRRRPYYMPSRTFADYQCAFRYGWENAMRREFRGRSFEQVERWLERGWTGKLITWKESREAVRDAWNRVRAGH
jgi:hypothetical protein